MALGSDGLFFKQVGLLLFIATPNYGLKFPLAILCSSLCFLEMCCLKPPLDVSSIAQYGQVLTILR